MLGWSVKQMVVIWFQLLPLKRTRKSQVTCNPLMIMVIARDHILGWAATTAPQAGARGWTEVVGAS